MERHEQQSDSDDGYQHANKRHQCAFRITPDAEDQKDAEHDENAFVPHADTQTEHDACDQERGPMNVVVKVVLPQHFLSQHHVGTI